MTLLMEILGWVGAALVLGAYALLSLKMLTSNGYIYQAMNIAGAFMLAIYGWWKDAIPSSLLNVIWCGIGIYAVIAVYKARGKDA